MIKKIEEKLKDLEKILSDENFWKNQNLAKNSKTKYFEDILNSYQKSLIDLRNVKDLFELAFHEKDEETINDCNEKIKKITSEVKNNEINCFLSDENDLLDIYLEIHAGAGGIESQDWADMLRRMYMKWFDKKTLGMKL